MKKRFPDHGTSNGVLVQEPRIMLGVSPLMCKSGLETQNCVKHIKHIKHTFTHAIFKDCNQNMVTTTIQRPQAAWASGVGPARIRSSLALAEITRHQYVTKFQKYITEIFLDVTKWEIAPHHNGENRFLGTHFPTRGSINTFQGEDGAGWRPSSTKIWCDNLCDEPVGFD